MEKFSKEEQQEAVKEIAQVRGALPKVRVIWRIMVDAANIRAQLKAAGCLEAEPAR